MTQTTETTDTLRGYLGAMVAAEEYVYELVHSQAGSDDIKKHPEISPVLEPLAEMLEQHIGRLEKELEQLGGTPTSASMKGSISVAAGKIGALVERIRSETASRMMRDTYCALSLITVSYTMLHAAALSLHQKQIADLALDHLNDLTPVVVEISKIVPFVVVNELADEVNAADRTQGPLSSNQTHEAWSRIASQPYEAASS